MQLQIKQIENKVSLFQFQVEETNENHEAERAKIQKSYEAKVQVRLRISKVKNLVTRALIRNTLITVFDSKSEGGQRKS